MPDNKVQFRLGPLPSLAKALRARDDAQMTETQIVIRDLERYYDLLALILNGVDLSVGEASLIVDALNGSHIDMTTVQMLAAEIEDSLIDGLAAKWEVDGAALVAKVRGWSIAHRLAVCDAVERFWVAGYHIEHTGDRLAAVGLIRRG